MERFTTFEAIAAPIDERNLDTNQLCPTLFNKLAREDPRYPRVLFNAQRFAPDGSEIADFVLNREPFRNAGILVADDNFGCGSSRESAVYALLACGIRAVVAPSFGDIFFNNSLRNGMLPVRLDATVCDALRARLHAEPGGVLAIDLEAETLTDPDGGRHPFSIPPRAKRAMMEGLDAIALTLDDGGEIEVFETAHKQRLSWVF